MTHVLYARAGRPIPRATGKTHVLYGLFGFERGWQVVSGSGVAVRR